MWWRRAWAPELALLAATLAACGGQAPPRERLLPVFGTLVTVQVAGTGEEEAQTAFDALEALYRRLDADWRSFGPGELGRANQRLAAGLPVTLSPGLRQLVERSLEVRDRSGGLFDPRVGLLIELWGFQDMARRTPAAAPAPEAIAAARAAMGAAVLQLSGNELRSTHPVRLELAGIAKGSALAAGAALLRDRGVADALIAAGGDVVVLGRNGGRPWRVGVRDPLRPGVLGTLELADGEAALSSGTYERRFESGGESYHHLIDPRTGRPARGTAGTTVVGRDPELANAAAAALLIGGAEQFEALARRLGADCALLVTDDGRLLMTPAMQGRLHRS